MIRLMLLLALVPACAGAQTLNTEILEHWLDRYGQAWEARDATAASRIFTPDALYYETPYASPFKGRAGIASYWQEVTADQRGVDFHSEVIAVNGDVGVAHWTARFTTASTGAQVQLDGVFVLRFNAEQLVSELREWWILRP